MVTEETSDLKDSVIRKVFSYHTLICLMLQINSHQIYISLFILTFYNISTSENIWYL